MNTYSQNSFPFTVSSAVLDLCDPLVKIFSANLFIYQRSVINENIMRVSSNSYLCSSSEVLDFILSLSPKNREPAKYDYGGTRKYVLMGATQPILTSFLREKFNVNHMLSRDERIGTNEWEHFIIGTTSNDVAMVNSYLNNMGLLDKFVAYFRNKANKLIDNSCKNSFKSGRPMQKSNFCGPQSLPDNYGLGG